MPIRICIYLRTYVYICTMYICMNIYTYISKGCGFLPILYVIQKLQFQSIVCLCATAPRVIFIGSVEWHRAERRIPMDNKKSNHLDRTIIYIIRGVESFISENHFQYPWTWLKISEKLYFIFMV